jgi:hypothetical protein
MSFLKSSISITRCVLIGVLALLRDQLSPNGICVWSTVAQDMFLGQTETGRILSQAAPRFLCLEGSGRVPLSRSGGLTCAQRLVSTTGRPALSQQYLHMELCGTGLILFIYLSIYLFIYSFICLHPKCCPLCPPHRVPPSSPLPLRGQLPTPILDAWGIKSLQDQVHPFPLRLDVAASDTYV